MKIFKTELASDIASRYAKKNVIINENLPSKIFNTLYNAKDTIANYARNKKIRIQFGNYNLEKDTLELRVGRTIDELKSTKPEIIKFSSEKKDDKIDNTFIKRVYSSIRLLCLDRNRYKEQALNLRKKLVKIGKITEEERHKMDMNDFGYFVP